MIEDRVRRSKNYDPSNLAYILFTDEELRISIYTHNVDKHASSDGGPPSAVDAVANATYATRQHATPPTDAVTTVYYYTPNKALICF